MIERNGLQIRTQKVPKYLVCKCHRDLRGNFWIAYNSATKNDRAKRIADSDSEGSKIPCVSMATLPEGGDFESLITLQRKMIEQNGLQIRTQKVPKYLVCHWQPCPRGGGGGIDSELFCGKFDETNYCTGPGSISVFVPEIERFLWFSRINALTLRKFLIFGIKNFFCAIGMKLAGMVVLYGTHLASKGIGDIFFRFRARGIWIQLAAYSPIVINTPYYYSH